MKKRVISILVAALVSCCAFAESYVVFTNPAVLWKKTGFIPTPVVVAKGDIFIKGNNMMGLSSVTPYSCKYIKASDGTFNIHDLTASYVVVHSLEEAESLDVNNVDYTEVYTSSGHNITHPGVLVDMISNY